MSPRGRKPALGRWLTAGLLIALTGLSGCQALRPSAGGVVPARPAGSPRPLETAAGAAEVPSPAPATPAAIRLETAGGKPIRLGLLCDRTGVTANLGDPFCDAVADVVTQVNETGGIRGRPIEVVEENHVADVPTDLDLLGRFVRRENLSAVLIFGNTVAQALIPAAERAGLPALTFGFGPSVAVNGARYPRTFQGTGCPQCQALALLEAMGNDWRARGIDRPGRIVYFHDGSDLTLDPFGTVIDYAGQFGLEVAGSVAIDPRTIDPRSAELNAAVAAAEGAAPDYGLVNLIGRPAGLLIQLQRRQEPVYPLYAFPWAISQEEINTGQEAAERYRGLQVTALAEENPPALVELRAYWQARNLRGSRWAGHVLYDRGIAAARLAIEAYRQADDPDDPASVVRGYEQLRDFTAGGYLPPVTFTPADHGGTRAVRLSEIRDQKLVAIGPWFTGPPPPDYPALSSTGW